MTATSKLFTAVGILLLLGFGLCGIDQFIPSSRTQEFGGNASFFGLLSILLALLVLILGVIFIVVRNLISGRKRKP